MKKHLNFIFLLFFLLSGTELIAQEVFSDLKIYELEISDKETVFSPSVLKISKSQIEIIIVSSEKDEDLDKIPGKFKKIDLNKIFNLLKITIENKPPYKIISKGLLSENINTKFQEGPVDLNQKRDRLYFTRSLQKMSKNKRLQLGIYESDYVKDSFRNPRKINFFQEEISVMHPAIDSKNKRIYFASNFDPSNNYDLYFSNINSKGEFEEPIKVPNVNSSSNEAFPFIFNNLLFFASNREGGQGGFDIYFSKIEEGEFQSPKLLPSPINTESDDFSFSLSDSLKYGFFSSSRKKDSIDISYIINFKPLKGNNDSYKYTSFKSNIEESKSVLENDSIKSNLFPFSNSLKTIVVQNPKYGSLELNPDGTFIYFNNDEKIIKDNFTYKISDGYRESIPIDVDLLRIETEIFLRPIYYDFAKFDLIKQYQPRLDSIAELMQTDANINLLISSTTDARGNFKSNLKLSKSRSKTIIRYLIEKKGINKNRLTTKDYGEKHLEGNSYSDYLIEVFNGLDFNQVNKKMTDFSSFKPFIYKNSDQSYSLIVGQFDTKKQGLKLINKLKDDNINSRLILNNFVKVPEKEHMKNRKTTFKMLLNREK
jgi:outer membrane protein OmpA-like peptidoglycan-associated protein